MNSLHLKICVSSLDIESIKSALEKIIEQIEEHNEFVSLNKNFDYSYQMTDNKSLKELKIEPNEFLYQSSI